MSAARKYWHGGQSGLKPGDYILPPAETDARHALLDFGTAVVARRDRVYVTPVYLAAVTYAAAHPSGGAVYEVEPVGEMEHDPDCTQPGVSWSCERARIIVARGISNVTRRKVLRALQGN